MLEATEVSKEARLSLDNDIYVYRCPLCVYIFWDATPPSNSSKWRFIRIPKPNNLGSNCYWVEQHPNPSQYIYISIFYNLYIYTNLNIYIYLFIDLFIYLSIYLFIYLSIYLFFVCIYRHVKPSFCLDLEGLMICETPSATQWHKWQQMHLPGGEGNEKVFRPHPVSIAKNVSFREGVYYVFLW